MAANARFTSRVKIEDDRPYDEALFTRTAWSRSFTFTIDTTGPRLSSTAMRASSFTSANTVGWWKKPLVCAPSASVATAASTSSGPEHGNSPRSSPVAGLKFENVLPDFAGTHLPPMSLRKLDRALSGFRAAEAAARGFRAGHRAGATSPEKGTRQVGRAGRGVASERGGGTGRGRGGNGRGRRSRAAASALVRARERARTEALPSGVQGTFRHRRLPLAHIPPSVKRASTGGFCPGFSRRFCRAGPFRAHFSVLETPPADGIPAERACRMEIHLMRASFTRNDLMRERRDKPARKTRKIPDDLRPGMMPDGATSCRTPGDGRAGVIRETGVPGASRARKPTARAPTVRCAPARRRSRAR